MIKYNNVLDDEYYNDVLALNMAWTLDDEETTPFIITYPVGVLLVKSDYHFE